MTCKEAKEFMGSINKGITIYATEGEMLELSEHSVCCFSKKKKQGKDARGN